MIEPDRMNQLSSSRSIQTRNLKANYNDKKLVVTQ